MNKFIKSIAMAVMLFACTNVFASSKKSIVCTTFPEYDWIMNILGSKASDFNVTLLQNKGTDLHSYQPSVKDIAKISTSDMFVYVGGESDGWVKKVLSNASNKNMIVVNMLEVLGDKVREEEIVEGMQSEEESGHSHEHNTSFTEADVEKRSVSDWNGEWQSVYPFVKSGELDKVCEYKAENDSDHDYSFYKNKFETAYNSDIVTIRVNAPQIEYISSGKSIKADYKYNGYAFRVKDDGSSQARFKFVKTGGAKEAPVYIVISDHCYKPSVPEHFHIFASNTDYDSIIWESTHYPTYYPADLSVDEIADDLMGIHHEEKEYDEHVWLSLNNAEYLTNEICSSIQSLDLRNADLYKKNAADYISQLESLNVEYKNTVNSSENKTVLFGDRFPFRYLTDDYGLKYYAAFVGCSAESEASFETVAFLSKKVDELGLNAVLTIEKSDKKIAKTIVNNTRTKNQQILELDSLQSITQGEIKNGRNYLSAMKKNLEVLKKALR